MYRRNKYIGKRSCYATYEDVSFTHTDKEVARSLMDLGREILEQEKLPVWAKIFLAGRNARKVARELVALGIADPDQVEVVEEGVEKGEAVSLKA
jgi:hypothetical protein